MQPNASNLETQLPRAVREQMKRVDARIEDRRTQRSGTPPAAPPPGATDPNDVDPAPPVASQTPVPPTPPAPTPVAPPPAVERENDPVYWRERFRVMQGINDGLRRDHAEVLQGRDQRIESLTDRVRELEQSAARPAPQTGKIDLSLFFKPDQIERFGEDQCEAMAHAAITAAGQQAQAMIDAEVKPLKDAAAAAKTDKVKQADAAFWAELERLVPDLDEVNAEEGWLAWLNVKDDEGETGQQRLNRHRAARNAQGVANVFRDYAKTKQRPAPPVAPGGGAGGGGDANPPAAPGKGYPSREEIKDFWKRSSTIRNVRDPRYVSDKERAEFETRLKLPKPGS